MRLDDKLYAARFEGLVNFFDVVNFVVNDRRRMIEIRPVGHAQHQANSTAIEKGHVGWSLKKVGHAKHVAIKGNRPVEVMHVDEDLADARKRRADRHWGSHESSLWLSPQKPGFLQLISTQFIVIMLLAWRKRR